MTTEKTQALVKKTSIRLFNEHGTASISVNNIADKCGISRGNLHYHFKNKHEIIRSIYQDIVGEIESGWYGDEDQPTLKHMAEMYIRQLELNWRYRFFIREMVALVRIDSVLAEKVKEFRTKRLAAVVSFFEKLVEAKVLAKFPSSESLKYLVTVTWILCDNWMNFIELQGQETDEEIIQAGYDSIVEILHPYLTDQSRKDLSESYTVVDTEAQKFHVTDTASDYLAT